MALLTRKELVLALDVSHATLSMAVKRGHLIENSKGKIDDKNEINALFIRKQLSKMTAKVEDAIQERGERPQPQPEEGYDLAKLAALKTKIIIKKTNEEYEIAKIKKEKLQGSVIPIELMQNIIVIVAESVKVAYMDANEDMLLKISAKHRLGRAEHGQLKSIQAGVINKAVDYALSEAKKQLKRIQAEYSNERGKGERK